MLSDIDTSDETPQWDYLTQFSCQLIENYYVSKVQGMCLKSDGQRFKLLSPYLFKLWSPQV